MTALPLPRSFLSLLLAGLLACSVAGIGSAAAANRLPLPFPCQQTTCDAELWLPTSTAGDKPPVIIMAHGFGGLRTWGLPRFAERFVQAGMAVYLFDYRGFGQSGGTPRYVVDGKEHVKDWVAAVDFIRGRPEVDGARLGLWGTSYSGGHVLVTAAQRPDAVKAVSSQVPFVSGWASSLRFPLKYQPVAAWHALRDLLSSDDDPHYVPIVRADAFAALICPECVSGYGKLVPPGSEGHNKVAARVFTSLPFYSPGSYADRVQAPVLLMPAEKDGLIPIDAVRQVAKKLARVEYQELTGADHFEPYAGPLFETVSTRQTAFFRQHLLGR